MVSCIACEDTRQTQKLLAHFEIHKPLVSYHEHNEQARTAEIMTRLERGESVALVSDAGTPLISDPGYRVVNAAVEHGFPVVPIPGPAAFVAALTASGLPNNEFRFIGFLPAKSGARRRMLEDLRSETVTIAAYESPHRILECLADVEHSLPNRPLVVARELTKLHEEFLRGDAAFILDQLRHRPSIKGEFTLLIGRAPEGGGQTADPASEVAAFEAAGLTRMDAIKSAAKKLGLPKREIYRLLTEDAAEADNSSPDTRRD